MKGQGCNAQVECGSRSTFRDFWLGAVGRLLRWYALARQRQQLASLSDRALKDVGLSRADIYQEAQRPFWDDPLSK
ncbi:DUF1127 domain-containing protein [Pseudomonas sp. nanlin1]|uniref:DUF1127 domain-containing protein n=1 Tax=Pseudomonas sp. nanlin1 TaxID=3040605 RepID=UPI00388D5422